MQDVDFDEIVLLPSTMKSIKALIRFSNEVARQSIIALDAALKARFVRDVAATLDAQLFSASGDGIATPKGMFARTGTQTLAVDGALTLDHLHDAEGLVLAANVVQRFPTPQLGPARIDTAPGRLPPGGCVMYHRCSTAMENVGD